MQYNNPMDFRSLDFSQFVQNIDAHALPGASTRKIARVWSAFVDKLLENPQLWLDALREAQEKQMVILTQTQAGGEPVVEPAKNDRRFASDKWRSHPFFSILMQTYLVNSRALRSIAEKIDMPADEKKILLFTVDQYINATAPSNFPGTNPEVVDEAVRTGGESLTKGMQNWMADMQEGMVKNTDTDAFTIGENIATSPGKIIFQNALMQIIEYAPKTKTVYSRPLLIVPPCINKYYILDLTEEKSLIRALVGAGFRVFLVSWVNAGSGEAHFRFDDYLREGVMTAIDAVSAVTRQKTINTLGFCIGGTLLVAALAALAEDGERPAASVTLLAAMLDFSDTGDIGLFIDEEAVKEREEEFADGGLVDGRELARGFAYLRPNDLLWPYVIGNYYQGKTPAPFDLLFWNADSTNLPGPMFAEYLRGTYLENRITRGTAVWCNAPILPSAIRAPVYAVACEKDHIVPWRAAYIGAQMMDKKARFVLAASGHIAGIVNPPAMGKGRHQVTAAAALPDNPDRWREKSETRDGSWWKDWFAWLKKKSGKAVAAPKRFGNARYHPLEDAPGSYVAAPRPEINGSHSSIEEETTS